MKKKISYAFGKDVYLLGLGKDGEFYWLEQATWDCDWYWGLGYVETYTCSSSPSSSRDIRSHNHFNSMFFKKNVSCYEAFTDFFLDIPLGENEAWKLLELMKAAYTAREYSDMLHTGGAHISQNPVKETIRQQTEYDRINQKVIPAIMSEVYKLLSPEEEQSMREE